MKAKYHISNTSGRWLVNGKKVNQLNQDEKMFMDNFFKNVKISNEQGRQNNAGLHNNTVTVYNHNVNSNKS